MVARHSRAHSGRYGRCSTAPSMRMGRGLSPGLGSPAKARIRCRRPHVRHLRRRDAHPRGPARGRRRARDLVPPGTTGRSSQRAGSCAAPLRRCGPRVPVIALVPLASDGLSRAMATLRPELTGQPELVSPLTLQSAPTAASARPRRSAAAQPTAENAASFYLCARMYDWPLPCTRSSRNHEGNVS